MAKAPTIAGTTSRVPPAQSRGTGRGGGGFAYRPPSAEELKERSQRRGSRDSFYTPDVNFFTPKVGANSLRILPPPPEKRDEWRSYGVELFIHYGIGTDEAGYLCLDKMKGEPCPICEERARAKAAGEDEYAGQLRPATRVSVYVIDRDQEGKGPLIWNMPQSLDADICGLAVNKKTGEVYAVDDPNAGFDISFNREGQGMITKYKAMQIDRERSPLSEDQATAEKWLAHVVANPLDDKMVFYSYDHIKNAFAGTPHATSDPKPAPEPATPAPAASGGRVRVRLAPAAAPAPAPAAAEGGEELPTYEEVKAMNVDQLGELGSVFGLEFPEAPFTSEEQLRDWICKEINIPLPAPAATTAAGGKPNWRAQLGKLK